MSNFQYDDYGNIFLARRLHKLRELITDQSDEVFVVESITAPSHTVSLLLHLENVKESNISRIASRLGYSHQLINHRLMQLTEMGFVERFADPRDGRRCLISLTRKGRSEARKIKSALPKISTAFEQIFSELDVDLVTVLAEAFDLLINRSIADRIYKPSEAPPESDRFRSSNKEASQNVE